MVEHVILHPFVGIDGRHFPSAAASGHDFYERRAFAGHRGLERFAYGAFGLIDRCHGVHTLPTNKARAF